MLGEPICVRTLSSHCKGPFRCSSIQQGVLVTVWRLKGTERERGIRAVISSSISYYITVQPNGDMSLLMLLHYSQCQEKVYSVFNYYWHNRTGDVWSHLSFYQRCFSQVIWCQIFNAHQSQSSGNPLAKDVWSLFTSHSMSPAFFLHYLNLSCWLTAAGAAPSPIMLFFLYKPATVCAKHSFISVQPQNWMELSWP